MKIISHRRNTISDLNATPSKYGIEVDIRSLGDQLIIHHDPFSTGENFEEWITHYQHGTLILNVKEEGLEERLINIMCSKNITDYFFLDQSFPFLIKWTKLGFTKSAVRVSEFESIDTALTLSGNADWIWVDCFSHFPLTKTDAFRLTDAGFKLCLVSPELQGFDANIEIPKLNKTLIERGIIADAVCTKRADLWEKLVK
jgi:hypothetical protein